MAEGRPCILKDTRNNVRWKPLEFLLEATLLNGGEWVKAQIMKALGKGDIAYMSNDEYVGAEFSRWIRDTKDDEPPRCVDLWQPEFGDLIAGIAEEHHINKLVDTASVGTEEYKVETAGESIDAVECPEDQQDLGFDQHE